MDEPTVMITADDRWTFACVGADNAERFLVVTQELVYQIGLLLEQMRVFGAPLRTAP
jgi:hypothetical protein